MISQVVKRLANRLGFDIQRMSNKHDLFSTHLQNVIKAKDIDCVLDVGANRGQYGELLRNLGFDGHIISFEPVTRVYEQLSLNSASDDRWTCFPFALGSQNSRDLINVYSSDVFSSFLQANEYSKSIWHSLEEVEQEEVEIKTLDSIFDGLKELTGSERFMLKLDTQGYDSQVFEGVRGSLSKIHVLQSELSMIPIYNEMQDVYQTLRAYNEAGFFISGMYPINRDESQAVIEFDCVLVRR